MFHLGQDFRIHESNVSLINQKIEDILIKSEKFSLPGKRRFLEENEFNYTIVDVTEQSKLHKLTKEEKRANQELARKRVKVENVIKRLKIFRILGERLSKSQTTTRTEVQANFRHLQL